MIRRTYRIGSIRFTLSRRLAAHLATKQGRRELASAIRKYRKQSR